MEARKCLRGVRGRVSHAQMQAQTASTFFHDRIPTFVRDEIEAIEKELWEKAKDASMDEIREEVEEWVMDLGTTTGKASSYERLMMLYWVMKNLM